MNEFQKRADPDRLLAALRGERSQVSRGRLKIFLGMAAGVGKTYAMLQAARSLKKNGIDVVVGICETHGRPETNELLQGLPSIDRIESEYKGARLQEMDLDVILKRRPSVVLVDELAHTNVPGSRHLKRYQDVIELLENGIDVYSTLNVQHLESRVDTVKQITGITVSETVPDSILELADEVVLIDIAPEQLLTRLKEGKVYQGDRADRALENFFQVGNLTALREIALKATTERVDQDLRNFMTLHRISGPWRTNHRLLVGVFASPYSEWLIRWTRNMAYALGAPWMGVYVEPSAPLSDAEKQLLEKNLTLVRQLGGEVILTTGESVAAELLRIAHQHNVTQIVAGKSRRKANPFLRRGTLVDQLIHDSGDIDVYVVSGNSVARIPTGHRARTKVFSWASYVAVSLIIMALSVLFYYGFLPFIGYRAVGVLYLVVVLALAYRFGRGPALLGAILSAATWDYFFIPPKFTFAMSEIEDRMTVVVYLIAAGSIGQLAARLKNQRSLLHQREEKTLILYDFSRSLSEADTVADVVEISLSRLERILPGRIGIVISSQGNRETHGNFNLPEKELAVVEWVLNNGRAAGHGTETLPGASGLYLPLLTPKGGVFGLLGVQLSEVRPLPSDVRALLEALCHQIEVALEREMLHDRSKTLLVAEQSEKLYRSLMDSISHELKTPLVAICGASSALQAEEIKANERAVEIYAKQISASSERLKRLVDNLLDMTRIESGHLQIKKDVVDVSDVVSTALERVSGYLSQRVVNVKPPGEVLLVQGDHVLLQQALVNI
jgi:two-component system sensor histidine kinase KdpD